MQKFGIWIFCFLVTCQATAQSNTADSIRRLLSQKLSDTARVMRMVDLAWEINETATDEAERQLQAAITLAQKSGFIKGEAAAWNGMGIVEEVRGNTAKALEHHHKALELRLKIGDMHSVAIQYSNLGNAYESAGPFEQALAAHRSGVNVAESSRDPIRLARSHRNM
ncbi:MAG: tetratricopeptide repeat protein, partial [Saprospiraceae bacterium]|nr:tetratricopeptide repeat protein [Saprospiraceae bacterium]